MRLRRASDDGMRERSLDAKAQAGSLAATNLDGPELSRVLIYVRAADAEPAREGVRVDEVAVR